MKYVILVFWFVLLMIACNNITITTSYRRKSADFNLKTVANTGKHYLTELMTGTDSI